MHTSVDVSSTMPPVCDFTVFGGTGDLALRKLLPALYHRDLEGHLPEDTRIVGVSRSEIDDEGYRTEVRAALERFVEPELLEDAAVERLLGRLHHLCLDADTAEGWHLLHGLLKDRPREDEAVRVFYLAVAPRLFGPTCERLAEIGVVNERARVVMEKPIGHDLESARAINDAVGSVFAEHQVFRIDHYLGKESVQNLLVTRFANTFLEPLWNSQWVDHVQITVSETVGVGSRGGYYDHAGALRDMVQNHLLQLLCLVAMEPPTYVGRENVRDEKLKVLQALKPLTPADVDRDTVRGQYVAGLVEGERAASYVDDLGGPACRSTCAPASGWTAASARSSWCSRSRRTRCSPAPRAGPPPTGCTSASSPTRACGCTSRPRSRALAGSGCGLFHWTSATPRPSTNAVRRPTSGC